MWVYFTRWLNDLWDPTWLAFDLSSRWLCMQIWQSWRHTKGKIEVGKRRLDSSLPLSHSSFRLIQTHLLRSSDGSPDPIRPPWASLLGSSHLWVRWHLPRFQRSLPRLILWQVMHLGPSPCFPALCLGFRILISNPLFRVRPLFLSRTWGRMLYWDGFIRGSVPRCCFRDDLSVFAACSDRKVQLISFGSGIIDLSSSPRIFVETASWSRSFTALAFLSVLRLFSRLQESS